MEMEEEGGATARAGPARPAGSRESQGARESLRLRPGRGATHERHASDPPTINYNRAKRAHRTRTPMAHSPYP